MRRTITVAFVLAFASPAFAEEKDSYAAVGYSTKTGYYWFAWGLDTKEKAEGEVSKRSNELLTVVSAKNCFLALAKSKDGKAFGVGQADTPNEAGEKALAECRKQTKQKCAVEITLHTAQGQGGDQYSAIAYSKSTGRYAAAVAKPSASQAEVEAIQKCDAKDAKVVVAAKNECCALALGKDKNAYGVAVAATEKEAQEKALEECKKKTTDCQVVATLAGKK
jgi:hypothetical protein